MPNIRYGFSVSSGAIRGALALGSSSNPTVLYTFGTALKGPDGAAGAGGIIDRIVITGSSSQAAQRQIKLFLASSSGPVLGLSNKFFDEGLPIGGSPIVWDGPQPRAKDSYTIQGYIDSTALDVYAQVDVSEIY